MPNRFFFSFPAAESVVFAVANRGVGGVSITVAVCPRPLVLAFPLALLAVMVLGADVGAGVVPPDGLAESDCCAEMDLRRSLLLNLSRKPMLTDGPGITVDGEMSRRDGMVSRGTRGVACAVEWRRRVVRLAGRAPVMQLEVETLLRNRGDRHRPTLGVSCRLWQLSSTSSSVFTSLDSRHRAPQPGPVYPKLLRVACLNVLLYPPLSCICAR